ncbi:MAG: hypothetical protein NTZ74_04665 [Chloroflexi bacterium]|nr:hypothetical protein [Chloroflexota bacterium]
MKNKKEIISRLSATTMISGISYKVFFFSRNLEHVLHDISREVSREDKNQLSNIFEDRYAENPIEFIDFINSEEFAVPGTFEETWSFIKNGINSLRRKSNFYLFCSE